MMGQARDEEEELGEDIVDNRRYAPPVLDRPTFLHDNASTVCYHCILF